MKCPDLKHYETMITIDGDDYITMGYDFPRGGETIINAFGKPQVFPTYVQSSSKMMIIRPAVKFITTKEQAIEWAAMNKTRIVRLGGRVQFAHSVYYDSRLSRYEVLLSSDEHGNTWGSLLDIEI